MKPILIVSNGHGEDTIGVALGKALAALGYGVEAVPLVGRGLAYEEAGFAVWGPRKEMPSGGFALQSPKALWADLRSGWFSMSLAHYRAVRWVARQALATLVVGDIYALLVGGLLGRRPLFLVQCRSTLRALGRPYSVTERLLMRRAMRVYPREPEGEAWLRARGVGQAVWLGNPMLDAVGEGSFGVPPPYLLLLPGSRQDAYESLPKMLEAARLLGDLGLKPVVAWAGLPLEPLPLLGWRLEATGERQGVTHRLCHPDGTIAYLARGLLKSLLLGSRVAVSTSGTAAEQAAGYGVPLVGFPTSGPQYTRAFAEGQKRLLGAALLLVEPSPSAIAQGVRRFLFSPKMQAQARSDGRAAMGEPGAAQRIALDLHRFLM
ncbi:MAG: lipid-A-disaccharide synthase-related protein [Meiothermus sp.]|uniref:lipid-A-disaccharide synthase-related protein n=1 Tax=Meiothermus sp. TaxID=1955249 RepID=UPI0026348E5D|nr:lipid-A-disaccharide synthase-related protein [Meiothermus sp.]MCS7059235.1 lipid-A-disaccharide synthase-related protein [Meiothermus sp.]MCX7740940.1 lipid-A-disaccharide synthase-related protein [Meiothermus sp.]MDW8481671.1 lipid-A-disaccharide synthase-related protein [Meiothermus sp.]